MGLVIVTCMVINIDQAVLRCFPVTLLTIRVDDGSVCSLDVMRVGIQLADDVHTLVDCALVALGAVSRQAESGMARYGLVLVAAVAGLS